MIQQGFRAGKPRCAGRFIKNMLAAVNDKGAPRRVESSDFLQEAQMVFRNWPTVSMTCIDDFLELNISEFPDADPKSLHMVLCGPPLPHLGIFVLPFSQPCALWPSETERLLDFSFVLIPLVWIKPLLPSDLPSRFSKSCSGCQKSDH